MARRAFPQWLWPLPHKTKRESNSYTPIMKCTFQSNLQRIRSFPKGEGGKRKKLDKPILLQGPWRGFAAQQPSKQWTWEILQRVRPTTHVDTSRHASKAQTDRREVNGQGADFLHPKFEHLPKGGWGRGSYIFDIINSDRIRHHSSC